MSRVARFALKSMDSGKPDASPCIKGADRFLAISANRAQLLADESNPALWHTLDDEPVNTFLPGLSSDEVALAEQAILLSVDRMVGGPPMIPVKLRMSVTDRSPDDFSWMVAKHDGLVVVGVRGKVRDKGKLEPVTQFLTADNINMRSLAYINAPGVGRECGCGECETVEVPLADALAAPAVVAMPEAETELSEPLSDAEDDDVAALLSTMFGGNPFDRIAEDVEDEPSDRDNFGADADEFDDLT